jgi:hypothetical protein
MKSVIRMLLFVSATGALSAQTAEIDIRQALDQITGHAKRLLTLLDQLEPENWVSSKGAPEAYVGQWKSSRAQAQALIGDAQSLAKEPDKLPVALQTYFRVQAVQSLVGSLVEAIRKYQNPAMADLFTGVAAEGSVDRERLQQYMVNLATEKEQMLKIMDHEAQRCRGMLSRQPAPQPTRK